jgi:tetratricopeptide (TPR) repeat protein
MWATGAGRLAGAVAATVFMTTPAVREAATHVEPRMFDACWALLSAMLFLPYAYSPKAVAWIFPIAIGLFCGLGLADTPLFFALLPLFLGGVVMSDLKRGKKAYGSSFLFLSVFAISFAVFAGNSVGDFTEFSRISVRRFREFYNCDNWLFVALFATLPFVTSLFSSFKAYNEESGWTQWFFHAAMTFVAILALATPLSPSSLMEPIGILPVATSAFAAAVAGYLAAYWWLLVKAPVRKNESRDSLPLAHLGRPIGFVGGGILALALAITVIWNLFDFDRDRGAFADRVAGKIIDDLGERTWFVTDGTLDDHLRLVAADRGKELNLICLNRDLDETYLESLGELVLEKKIGGSKNAELSLSLSLGVLPFVQDWFSADPEVAREVAIYGAPDLWYTAGIKPVPEFAFFGADPKRAVDPDSWKEYAAVLHAPQDWGSYRARKVRNPVDRLRLGIRRHLGFVANNRGVYLQDSKKDDEAYAMYDLVLSEIDPDNICALFNLFEMARAKHPKADARKNELEKTMKGIIEDKDRRYHVRQLGKYYGYIRSPEIFIRLGFTWARSGRPGDALSQIKRAIDFIPTDRRATLMNMMAALYASEYDQRKSREMYRQILASDAKNHDALIGMMRLELLDGNSDKALEYLEQAAEVSPKGARANIELAMVAMMKNELVRATDLLRKATDATPDNMQAWSLLAAVEMQRCDAIKDKKGKDAVMKELETVILPKMEKLAKDPFDYYLQTTRAFILMRKGAEKRREARDAFVNAAKARPDIGATHDLILGLDISLNDVAAAESHARNVLRRNRKAPLANYVMGALALQRGDYKSAEAFLRRAADAHKPVVLALNDLAEVLRRNRNFPEAERYARMAVKEAPKLYVAWETLGSILLGAKREIDEAERCILKACELSKVNGREEDVRMLVSLARVQIAKGDKGKARVTMRKVQSRIDELSAFEKQEFEELRKGAR